MSSGNLIEVNDEQIKIYIIIPYDEDQTSFGEMESMILQ